MATPLSPVHFIEHKNVDGVTGEIVPVVNKDSSVFQVHADGWTHERNGTIGAMLDREGRVHTRTYQIPIVLAVDHLGTAQGGVNFGPGAQLTVHEFGDLIMLHIPTSITFGGSDLFSILNIPSVIAPYGASEVFGTFAYWVITALGGWVGHVGVARVCGNLHPTRPRNIQLSPDGPDSAAGSPWPVVPGTDYHTSGFMLVYDRRT